MSRVVRQIPALIRIKFLRNILLSSLAVVVMFPLYDIFVAYPAFLKSLSQEAQDQSVRTSTHLTSSFKLQERELGREYLKIDPDEIELIKKDLSIVKIKIFSVTGEAVYSTDPADQHGIGEKKEFQEFISQGEVYSKVKKGGTKSLEGGEISSAYFVETYVPIIKEGRFVGAIEIYYDVTTAKERFDSIRLQAILIVLALATVLLALVFITSYRAGRIIMERDEIARERERLIYELQDALEKVKTLRGLLPICCSCNKIRDTEDKWTEVDVYISKHSEAEFTHGYCDDCAKKHFSRNFED